LREERVIRLREYGLTVGTMGSNAAQTLIIALLPVLLGRYTDSAALIGAVIGAEGILAIFVPYWIGYLSDHLPNRLARRFGRRAFFLWTAAPLMTASLVVVPFLRGFWPLATAGILFFTALQGFVTPLWALMIDAVPDERRARVQGVRGAFQAIGLAFGLIGGGLLFEVWEPLPFVTAGFVLILSTWFTALSAPSDRGHDQIAPARRRRGPVWRRLLKRSEIRWFLVANGLWNGAIDGIRPYIFLYAGAVFGISVGGTSGLLVFLLLGVGLGAVAVGRLSDVIGRARLLMFSAGLCGLAMLVAYFPRTSTGIIWLLAAAGLAAASFIALPFPVFARLTGDEAPGRQTALFIVSIGVSRVLAPVLVGAVIDFSARFDPELRGYPFMWVAAGGMALLSVPALLRAVSAARRRERANAPLPVPEDRWDAAPGS
jgi:MFS family permease